MPHFLLVDHFSLFVPMNFQEFPGFIETAPATLFFTMKIGAGLADAGHCIVFNPLFFAEAVGIIT